MLTFADTTLLLQCDRLAVVCRDLSQIHSEKNGGAQPHDVDGKEISRTRDSPGDANCKMTPHAKASDLAGERDSVNGNDELIALHGNEDLDFTDISADVSFSNGGCKDGVSVGRTGFIPIAHSTPRKLDKMAGNDDTDDRDSGIGSIYME